MTPRLPISNQSKTLLKNAKITQDELKAYRASTHPIADSKVLQLLEEFLSHKKSAGSKSEKKLYQNMTPEQLVTRLLTQRPKAFLNSSDYAMLRDGEIINGPGSKTKPVRFEDIGTDREKSPLILKDYISYDEMQISALLGLSSETAFINDGNRFNRGTPSDKDNYQAAGVYVGHVGARFEKPGLMEYQFMIVTEEQNTAANGYGSAGQDGYQENPKFDMWKKYYGVEHFPSFEEAKQSSDRFLEVRVTGVDGGKIKGYLDKSIFKERMRGVIAAYLADANQRGEQAGKKVYLRAVGLGTGAWAVNSAEQEKIMVNIYKELVAKGNYKNISNVDFTYFTNPKPSSSKSKFLTAEDQAIETINGIQLGYSVNNPATKLSGADADKLLVADYAWDGGSYPGNEYWLGPDMLAASGDPAAACCSLITELQSRDNHENVNGNKLQSFDVPTLLLKETEAKQAAATVQASVESSPVPKESISAPSSQAQAAQASATVVQSPMNQQLQDSQSTVKKDEKQKPVNRSRPYVTGEHYLKKPMIEKIKAQLGNDHWVCNEKLSKEPQTGQPMLCVSSKQDPSNQFQVYANKFSTSSHDAETFKVMLECFKVANQEGVLPQITAPKEAEQAWKQACKAVYGDDMANKIQITLPRVQQAAPPGSPATREKEEEFRSSGPRR